MLVPLTVISMNRRLAQPTTSQPDPIAATPTAAIPTRLTMPGPGRRARPSWQGRPPARRSRCPDQVREVVPADQGQGGQQREPQADREPAAPGIAVAYRLNGEACRRGAEQDDVARDLGRPDPRVACAEAPAADAMPPGQLPPGHDGERH